MPKNTTDAYSINKYELSFRNAKGQLQKRIYHAATPEDVVKRFTSDKKNRKFVILGVQLL
jgi:hypothetical protein